MTLSELIAKLIDIEIEEGQTRAAIRTPLGMILDIEDVGVFEDHVEIIAKEPNV